MRDFPVFTTEYGVASLVLKEVPYQGNAYIVIRDSLDVAALLAECVSFCRMCGAERIYATGHEILQDRLVYATISEMSCCRQMIPDTDTDAVLVPVTPDNLESWREIYNQKVRHVPNGAWMTQTDAKAMFEKREGYFVERNGVLLGTGRVSGQQILWVASLHKGAGRDVLCALAGAIEEEQVVLTVADENTKARELYERIGFRKKREICCWYQVI